MRVSSFVQPDPVGSPSSGRSRPREQVLRSALTPWLVGVMYVAPHIPFLAPSLEDIDSINFALGLRTFSPALHQPHPPGYPIYIALGHMSLAVVERVTAMTRVSAEAWSLALWSAIGGGACIVAAWFLFVAVTNRLPTLDARLAEVGSPKSEVAGQKSIVICATLLLAASPLFWLTGLRPMSDMPGLALAIGAQALLL